MRQVLAISAAAAFLGSAPALAMPQGDAAPFQMAQVQQEQREVLRERRDVRESQGDLNAARRDFRQADTPQERRIERRNLNDARRDVREEKRELLEERRDLRDTRLDARRDQRDARLEALRPEVRTRVYRYVTTTRPRVAQVPYGFAIAAGTVLPETVYLEAFPAEIGLSDYRYVVIGQQAVLVEPRTRRIVEIIR